MRTAVIATDLDYPCCRGKVRDVYDLGQFLWIVSTDRISAFDWVLPGGIPDKGIVLNQISRFWFERLQVPHHMVSTAVPPQVSLTESQYTDLGKRSMLVHKAEVIPFECVVRGYLEGSGWKEYQRTGSVCGLKLPGGLKQCDALTEPIFTPATKAAEGHDENVSFEAMVQQLGSEVSSMLRAQSLEVYRQGCLLARERGIIIADTKFEWGWLDGKMILVDEVLTPDSSRFWPADRYSPGRPQPSLDKQFVREWLQASQWDRESPPPELPGEVIEQTRRKYIEVFELLTQESFSGS